MNRDCLEVSEKLLSFCGFSLSGGQQDQQQQGELHGECGKTRQNLLAILHVSYSLYQGQPSECSSVLCDFTFSSV